MATEKVSNKSRRINVGNSIKLNPQNPLPITYNGNSFSSVTGKAYIPVLNRKDNLPGLLLEARLTSPTHSSCISSIASAVVGNGLSILNTDNISVPFEDVDKEFAEWIKSVNNDFESLDEILTNTIDGEREQGNQFIKITKGALGQSKFLKVDLLPMQYCRFAEVGEGQTEPTVLLYSKTFAKKGYKYNEDETEDWPLFSANSLDQDKCWKSDSKGNLVTVIHFKNKVRGVEHYGLPSSISGLRFQVLEGKAAQFNLDNFDNNMVLGGMLVLKSAMTEDEASVQADKIMEAHVGEGKAGRLAVVSSENGVEDAKYIPFETQKEGSYIELDDKVEMKIIASNNWHKALLGIMDAGALGSGSNFMRSIWDSKEMSLLNPLRRKLTDKVVGQIVKIYADHFSKKELTKYSFWFKSAAPFSTLGDLKPESYMQVNEAREMAGLDMDENKKGVYLAEVVPSKQNQPKPPENV